MKHDRRDRMANPLDRSDGSPRPAPQPPVPVVRELVQPPPEYRIKCPHCGAAGRLSTNKATHGTIPRTGENRRTCTSCGAKLAFTTDWRAVRVIG